MLRCLRLFLLACLLTLSAKATHIVGGEMSYFYLGSNQYRVTLTVYRDCYNGQAGFDNPAAIGIFNQRGDLVASLNATISNSGTVANTINSPCLVPPTNVCYEYAIYQFTTLLPPIPGGYTIAYQRCCRNSTILNLAGVQSTGATYFATVPDTTVVPTNSSPSFNLLPPTFICSGVPFTFDHSATDPDGDSLVYSLKVPYAGADPGDPAPSPPGNPPYTPVVFQPPYSVNDFLGGVPMTIEFTSGLLKATPNMTGQFVYGISVKEYRNGVFIGETFRDFQVNVVPCPTITVASIFSPTIACGSLRADFVNTSAGAATYTWDFGDPTRTDDTSSAMNPSWTYPDTGEYQVTLIAYSDIDPACNDTTYGLVKAYPPFNAALRIVNQRCSPVFTFVDSSYGIGGSSDFWRWSFGDGQIAQTASATHAYASPGAYPVTLIASTDSGCTDTATVTVNVLRLPEPDFSLQLDTCTFALRTVNSSAYASLYRWDFGDGRSSAAEDTSIRYADDGLYTVTLEAVTDSGCARMQAATVFLPPLPEAGFVWSVDPCDSTVRFDNRSTNALSYTWDFGDGATGSGENIEHTYEKAGSIPVVLIARSRYGCLDTLVQDINFTSYKGATFDWQLDSCSGEVRFYDVTRNAVTYRWDFGDGTVSTRETPVHVYRDNGTYRVLLTVNGESACIDTVSRLTVYESPLGERLFVPNAFTPNGDGKNEWFSISVFRPCEQYELFIFDRWGQEIFHADDAATATWDGTIDGRPAETGLYVYLLRSASENRTGTITLLR
jgi:gliding motility-associated-like protein